MVSKLIISAVRYLDLLCTQSKPIIQACLYTGTKRKQSGHQMQKLVVPVCGISLLNSTELEYHLRYIPAHVCVCPRGHMCVHVKCKQ